MLPSAHLEDDVSWSSDEGNCKRCRNPVSKGRRLEISSYRLIGSCFVYCVVGRKIEWLQGFAISSAEAVDFDCLVESNLVFYWVMAQLPEL